MHEFEVPQTCGTGFNSIRFDDEFIRQMLYRNFRDPYAREWRNGNSRWDVIDLFRAAYALRPQGFVWPEREPGIPSFKLEDLAQANGVDEAAFLAIDKSTGEICLTPVHSLEMINAKERVEYLKRMVSKTKFFNQWFR